MGDTDKDSGVLNGMKGWFGDLVGNDEWREWEVNIEKIIIHPQYDTSNGKYSHNDIFSHLRPPTGVNYCVLNTRWWP